MLVILKKFYQFSKYAWLFHWLHSFENFKTHSVLNAKLDVWNSNICTTDIIIIWAYFRSAFNTRNEQPLKKATKLEKLASAKNELLLPKKLIGITLEFLATFFDPSQEQHFAQTLFAACKSLLPIYFLQKKTTCTGPNKVVTW